MLSLLSGLAALGLVYLLLRTLGSISPSTLQLVLVKIRLVPGTPVTPITTP